MVDDTGIEFSQVVLFRMEKPCFVGLMSCFVLTNIV